MTNYWKWLIKSLRKITFYKSSFWKAFDIFGYWKFLYKTLRELDFALIKVLIAVYLITISGCVISAYLILTNPIIAIGVLLLTIFFGITWIIYSEGK